MSELEQVAEKKKQWITSYCQKVQENAKETQITRMYHRMQMSKGLLTIQIFLFVFFILYQFQEFQSIFAVSELKDMLEAEIVGLHVPLRIKKRGDKFCREAYDIDIDLRFRLRENKFYEGVDFITDTD